MRKDDDNDNDGSVGSISGGDRKSLVKHKSTYTHTHMQHGANAHTMTGCNQQPVSSTSSKRNQNLWQNHDKNGHWNEQKKNTQVH